MDMPNRLIAVVRALSSARSLEPIMEIVRHAARELTGADGATFVLREGDDVYYADEDAMSPLWKGQRFPMSACISGWAITHRQIVTVPDIYADTRIPHDVYRSTFVQSLVMTPIRVSDPLGAIGTYWRSVHEATEEEVTLLSALADSTAIALENVELIRQLKDAKEAAEAREGEMRELYARAQDDLGKRLTLEHELMEKIAELETFHDVVVGRELKLMELEREVSVLQSRLARYEGPALASRHHTTL